MFRLIRFLLWLAALGGLVWFSVTVPLGKKTLVEHFQSIWRTDETQELVEGSKEAARPVIQKIAETLQPDGGVRPVGKPGSAEQAHEDRKWMQRSVDRYHKK